VEGFPPNTSVVNALRYSHAFDITDKEHEALK